MTPGLTAAGAGMRIRGGIAAVLAAVDPVLWVVTAGHGGRRGGLVATFVSEASIVPEAPRVAVGLACQHHTRDLVEASGAFALHLLGEDLLDWVWRFGLASGREVEKLAGLETRTAATGAPILAGALGWLDCRVEARVDAGDRTIYLAAVEAGALEEGGDPLTVKRMLALAPPERSREMEGLLARDIEVDRKAIRAWRACRP
jgi:flavin reductase (DIM6/NTAB) family NADH-FMN oxidoreductase RutF